MNALNAYNKLNANVAGLKKASEKLSSGYRINRAGDDAAGLAISEKMRSQIRGLNQAVRNSQDGINMIQTFEGAAQETHSILQRMKELASESANGTYDNTTDRAAIQLEFEQLNDELNQIADTDFNGTIVLNGGEMADGLKAVDGEFDYRNKADQVAASNLDALTEAQNKANVDIEAAQKLVDEKQKALDLLGGEDISQNGSGPNWGSVDSSTYTKEAADGLWVDLGYKDDKDNADVSDVNAVDVSFRMKDDGTWEAYDGYDSNGKQLTAEQLAQFAPQDPTVNGGFTVKVGTTKQVDVNSVFDSTNAKAGDTVTLTFTNTPKGNYAPTNAGFVDESLKLKDGSAIAGGAKWTGSVTISDALKADGIMDTKGSDIKAALDALFSKDGVDKSGNKTLSFEASYDDDGNLETVKIGGTKVDLDEDGKVTINGVDLHIKGEAGKFTISLLNEDGTAGTSLLEISLGATLQDAAGTGLESTVSGEIVIDAYNFDPDAERPDVEASKDRNLDNATEVQKAKDALRAANEALAKAQEAYPKSVDDLNLGVTKADAFDNSTARMTYTDNITLQTGSRTKDAVNFTFKYNQDGSADMGDLVANLNLSARADGLNTANLSLATQEDANKAIDQIDKAINKTSMVRATFGAIQNRLEHKITNLTTTSENLQEAESSIRDTDMASEMMNYTKYNILQQAAQSMLAQANQQPQSILQLLG